MTVKISDAPSYVSVDDQTQTLILDLDGADFEADSTLEVELQFVYDELILTSPLTVTVTVAVAEEECKVESLVFVSVLDPVSYEIGSGKLEIPIPEIKQDPNCGIELTHKFVISSIISVMGKAEVNAAITIDQTKAQFEIKTDNFSFADKDVTLVIGVTTSDKTIKTKQLTMRVSFYAPAFAFDMTKFEPKTLSCAEADSAWSIKLPPLLSPQIQDVSITMISS